MRVKKIKGSLLLILALVLALGGCGNQAQGGADNGGSEAKPVKLKISTNVPPGHIWTQTVNKFKEDVEKQTDGRITVEVFPSSQLGGTNDVVQMLNSGSVDYAVIPTAFLTSSYPDLNAWFMPFLFEDMEDAMKMRGTDESKELLKVFAKEQNFKGVDWLFTGNHSILMKNGKMDSPEDFKGKKIRAPGTQAVTDLYNALGASAVSMPLTEVYSALKTGVVDGINASVNSIASQKYHEIANDFTLLNQTAFNAVVLQSNSTNKKLSDSDLELINNAMKSAVDWGNDEAITELEENMKKVKKTDLNIHEVEDLKPFLSVKDEIYQKYSEKSDVIKAFIEKAQD